MENVAKLYTNEVYEDIHTFLDDLKHGSEKTYQRYKASIELFFEWYKGKELYFITPEELSSIDYETLKKFRSWMKNEKNYANSTTNNTMTSIYSMIKELRKVGKNKYNLPHVEDIRLKNLKLTDSESHGDIGWEESTKMIEYLKQMSSKKKPLEKSTLVHIARMTGIRLSGLLGLKYKDLRRENGLWVLYHSLKGKRHSQAIKDSDAEMLLQLRETDNDEEKIFKISSKSVERMMAELVEKLGFDPNRNISFHSIRRLYGKEVFDHSNNNLLKAQQYLGHSNVNTTKGYVEREQNLQDSPALFIGDEMDETKIDHLEKEDFQKIFSQLSRSSQYEFLHTMKNMKMDKGHS